MSAGWRPWQALQLGEWPRRAIIGEAARTLAEWFTTSGLTPAEVAARIDAGENWVVDALASLPPPEIQRARVAFAAVVRQLTPQDFWEILKHDALHTACGSDHAEAVCYARWLGAPDRWPRTLAAFQAAQAWLSQTGAEPPAVPPPTA